MEKGKNIQTGLYCVDSLRQKKHRSYFELLTRYEEELLNDKSSDPCKFLEKCPESEREKMVFSLNLATLFLTGKNNKKDMGRLSKTALQKVKRRCYENIVKNHR